MPNRLVRDGILDSDRYWSVTIEARLLFFHLILLADDLGCVSLAPAFIRRRCFDDGPSQDKVDRLLMQLADVDLIRVYNVNGARYGFIPRFRQRLQRVTLRHPEPPDSLLEGDDDAKRKFCEINSKSKNPTDCKPLVNELPTDGQPPEVEVEVKEKLKPLAQSFAHFWVAYPKKRSKGQAERAWAKLKPNEQLLQNILVGIERAKTSEQWCKDHGQFIPNPATWLNARCWEDEIVFQQPARRLAL